MKYASVLWLVLPAVLFLSSCDNIIITEPQRITFALVTDELSLNTKVVHADVHDHDADGAIVERVDGPFMPIPGSATVVVASMTTLEPHPTSQRYLLIFWVDVDGDGSRTAGDREGFQHFEVMPNAVHSEAKVFAVDLATIAP